MSKDILIITYKLLQEYRYKEILPELYPDLMKRTDNALSEMKKIINKKVKNETT